MILPAALPPTRSRSLHGRPHMADSRSVHSRLTQLSTHAHQQHSSLEPRQRSALQKHTSRSAPRGTTAWRATRQSKRERPPRPLHSPPAPARLRPPARTATPSRLLPSTKASRGRAPGSAQEACTAPRCPQSTSFAHEADSVFLQHPQGSGGKEGRTDCAAAPAGAVMGAPSLPRFFSADATAAARLAAVAASVAAPASRTEDGDGPFTATGAFFAAAAAGFGGGGAFGAGVALGSSAAGAGGSAGAAAGAAAATALEAWPKRFPKKSPTSSFFCMLPASLSWHATDGTASAVPLHGRR